MSSIRNKINGGANQPGYPASVAINNTTFNRDEPTDQQWLDYLAAWGDLDPTRLDNLQLSGKTSAEQVAAAKAHWDAYGQFEDVRVAGHPWAFEYSVDSVVENGRRMGTTSGLFTQSYPESFTTDNNKYFERSEVQVTGGGTAYAYNLSGQP